MIEYIDLPQLAGTAAGTVTSSRPINAELLAYYVASNSEGTATLAATNTPAVTIATLTGGAGTAWYYPRVQGCDVGGTAISGAYDTIPLQGYVSLSLNAGGTVNATLAIQH